MFCPNGDGTFIAFQPVASIAGGSGWYYEPVLVEPGPGSWADGGPQSEDAFVSAWLTDDGVSGTRFDRPGFLAMMEEVEAGRVEAIVIKDCCAIMGLNQKDLENQGILA